MTEIDVELIRNTRNYLSYVLRFKASKKSDFKDLDMVMAHLDTLIEEKIKTVQEKARKNKIKQTYAKKAIKVLK